MQREIINLCFCTLGAFLIAVGVTAFLSPNYIAAGGPSGIAIILFHTFGYSKGIVVFLVNAILMVPGLRLLGMAFLLRTCYAVVAQSLFIELLNGLFNNQIITTTPLLNAVYGGGMVGIGLGLVFRGQAASGGWTMMARLIASRFKYSVGNVVFFLDSCVIVVSGFAFGNVEAAMWAGIGVYGTGVFIDFVMPGTHTSKLVLISSAHAVDLNALFHDRLHETGSTLISNSHDSTSCHQSMVLIVDRAQVNHLIKLVSQVDARAHVVVMDAVEFFKGDARKNLQR